MRQLHPTDLSVAARALLLVAPAERAAFATHLIDEAHIADRCYKRLHRNSTGGNGTLEGAARRYPLAEPPVFGDPENLACMGILIDALLSRREAQRRAA